MLPGNSQTLPNPKEDKKKKKKQRRSEAKHARVRITSSLSFQQEEEAGLRAELGLPRAGSHSGGDVEEAEAPVSPKVGVMVMGRGRG